MTPLPPARGRDPQARGDRPMPRECNEARVRSACAFPLLRQNQLARHPRWESRWTGLNRDINQSRDVGRKGGAAGGSSSMEREGQMKEGWQNFRNKVRSKWNQLSDRDLDLYRTRGRNDLVGFIGERTGNERGVIERDVDNIARETNYRWD